MYRISSDKSVSEIVGILRAEGARLDMIPSDISDGIRSSFSAVLHDSAGSGGGLMGRNEPGVRVVIYDSGDIRIVELEALSVSPMGQKFNLKKSEQLCEELFSKLNQGTPFIEQKTDPVRPETNIKQEKSKKEETPVQKTKDDFASRFMKGFNEINPAAEAESLSHAAKPQPEPESHDNDINIVPPASGPVPEPATWICGKCGKTNAEGAKFCSECGAPKSGTEASAGITSTGKKKNSRQKPVSRKTLLIAGGIFAAVLLAVLLTSILNRPKAVQPSAEIAPNQYQEDASATEENHAAAEAVEDSDAQEYENETDTEAYENVTDTEEYEGESEPSGDDNGMPAPEERIYAHRGTGGVNDSFESYDAAIGLGAKCIEQDVILSDSGELYVSKTKVSDDELQSDGYITLRDVFARYGTSVNYIVEIKTRDEATVNAFISLVDRMGVEDCVQAQCFETWVLDEIRDAFPYMKTIYLVDDAHGGQDALDKALNLSYIDIISVSYDNGLMTGSNCDKVHSYGKQFSAWVLNDENAITKAINMGVDTYFTVYPDLAIELEKEYR